MPNQPQTMSGSERVAALFAGRRPDRVPNGSLWTSLGFNTYSQGGTLAEAYDDPEKSFAAFTQLIEQYGWETDFQIFRHTLLAALDFGGRVRSPRTAAEGAPVVEAYPVQNEAEAERLQLPNPLTAGTIPLALRFARLQVQHDLPVHFYTRSPFCMAANICGVGTFFRWLARKPELCRHLMELAFRHTLNVLNYWVETFGAERMIVWVSSPTESNQLAAPGQIETFALPWHHEYHRCLTDLGIRRFGLHLCGDQNRNLPLLASDPPWRHPSILSFGPEVELETAAAHFPEDIIFGNLDPALIQTATPARVYEHTRRIVEQGKRLPGGFVFAPGCDIPVMSPRENVAAMTAAVKENGVY